MGPNRRFIKFLPLIIAIILFIIPFFWFKNGFIDLGGDDTRLFFYDPLNFLKSSNLYALTKFGVGSYDPRFIYIPYVGFMAILNLLISPSVIGYLIDGIKLSVSFLSIYLIVYEMLRQSDRDSSISIYLASIMSGLFYLFSYGSINMAFFWQTPIVTHNQIFLNPLIFYLFLKFIKNSRNIYLYFAIIVTVIFAPDFGSIASPPFFSFYPLSILFLLIYVKFILKTKIPWLKLIFILVLFLTAHQFHLLPEIMSLTYKGTIMNNIVFSKSGIINGGLNFFDAIYGQGKVSLDLLLPSGSNLSPIYTIFIPIILISGFLINHRNKKLYLIISIFFLVTLYFVSANITNSGLFIYRHLFYIPGFSMFRHFDTQFFYIYIFFYSLAFGIGFYTLINKLKRRYKFICLALYLSIFIYISIPLLTGNLVTKPVLRGSDELRSTMLLDPEYSKVLSFVRNLPDDGNFVILPISDFFHQLISGVNQDGIYLGPSTLMHLTDKYSFPSYQSFGYSVTDSIQYAGEIFELAKENNFDQLYQIFSNLGIRYILYNSDPKIYDEQYWPGFAYYNARNYFPSSQIAYQEFIEKIPKEEIYSNGYYHIYKLDDSIVNPNIYLPDGIYSSNKLSKDIRYRHWSYIDPKYCENAPIKDICNKNLKSLNPNLKIEKINTVKYKLKIDNKTKPQQIFLVMLHQYYDGWQLVYKGKTIEKSMHIPVNGYANGWLIYDENLLSNPEVEIYLEFKPQIYLIYGSFFSIISIVLTLILLVKDIYKRYAENKFH